MSETIPLVPPVDITHYRNTARNRVLTIGIELEGGWNELPKGCTLPIRDTSVHVIANYVGEYPSPVLNFDPESKNYWKRWLTKMYPQHLNESCGMHVHMSFRTALTYQRLMSPKYPATIVAYVKQWALNEPTINADHCIWGRLAGNSAYCQHVFHADEQVKSPGKDFDQRRVGHRYTVINYCWRNSTLECRLLPMMPNVEVAAKAIQEIVDITNGYLIATRAREKTMSAGLEYDPGLDVKEEDIMRVRV